MQIANRVPTSIVVISCLEDFYQTLWQAQVDQDVHVTVERPGGRHAITVRPVDRYRLYRTSDQ